MAKYATMEGSPVPTAINTGTKAVVENTGKGIKVFNDASNQSFLDHYIAFFVLHCYENTLT